MTSESLFVEFPDLSSWRAWAAAHRRVFTGAHVSAALEHIKEHGVREPLFGRRFAPSEISIDESNIRESIVAGGLNARMRGLLFDWEQVAQASPSLVTSSARIYAPEAITTFALLLRGRFPRFLGSEFGSPELLFPIPSEDLHALSFDTGRFDMAIASEVFEHLHDLDGALRELRRILTREGVLLSTFPFRVNARESLVRARLEEDGTTEHVLEPEYHGNPLAPTEGSLVYEVPGWDILDRVRAAGFARAQMDYIYSAECGILTGGAGGVFVLRARA